MHRIAITGGLGFIGQYTVRELLKDTDVQLRLLVRTIPPTETRDTDRCEYVPVGDLWKAPSGILFEAINGCDTLIHLAWSVSDRDYLSSISNLDCVNGSIRLAQAIQNMKDLHLIGLGTVFEYDLSRGYLPINSPLKGETLYSAAKIATFEIFKALWIDRPFSWARVFYVYGDGEPEHKLYTSVKQHLLRSEILAMSSGNQIRDFVPVEKVAKQLMKIAIERKVGIYNLCSGQPKTVKEFAEGIALELGQETDLLRFGTRPDNLTDPPFIVGKPNL